MLICLCWWTPIRAEKVYVEERGEPVREIENAVLYTFVWTRHYSLCLWKVFLSGGWTVESWEHNVIIMGRHTLKYACNFVFVPLFLNSCNHLSRCHWTMGKGVGLEKITSLPQGRGGDLLQVSSRGDGWRMFLGLTFSILGFFLGYENLAILFLGGLIHGGVCISWLQNTNI